MSIQTDLSTSPYFDDYNEQKDFYKILFRPGVAVQARELNQLQTLLQKQIERFGNNIFKQGTIIDGCSIAYHSDMKYVKIRDIQTDSVPVNVESYKGYRIKNSNNITPLEASIIETAIGFESTRPDLNTLFVRYIKSGTKTGGPAEGQSTFEPNEILTVYSPDNKIEKININEKSSGFSSTDSVVVLSAIAVQNTTGGTAFANNFSVGNYLSDGTANVQITGIDTVSVPNTVVLKITPRAADLKAADYSKWALSVGNTVRAPTSSPAIIVNQIGSGASATLTTSALGRVENINVVNSGSGYTILPNISIVSPSATVNQIELFSATAQNYLTNITVASEQFTPIGNTYAITVSEGIIYQKGYFSRVKENLVIVEKYNNMPDQKSVGFETVETIITSNDDDSLLDNATGAPNYTAPGANRLQLMPNLVVLDKAEADRRSDWLYITEFNNGQPYKQNTQTVYNKIGNYVAQRQYETAGNFVLNPFLLNTKNASSFVDEATKFNIMIDPGTGYINGTRVETLNNYEQSVNKGTDTQKVENGNISINFGNYVYVKEYAGNFNFKTGATVYLYPTAGTYLTSKAGSAISASGLGSYVGRARIRSVIYDSGVPGSPDCVYRLYLFDISMNAGKNFSDVKSIFYDQDTYAICDVVLENGVANIKDNQLSSLIYYAGNPAVANVSAVSYNYRTVNNYTISTGGVITIALASPGSEIFPYVGTLSSTQERDVIIVPLANTASSVTLGGPVSCNTTSTSLIGTNPATNSFLTDISAGDYIKVGVLGYAQIKSVSNNTFATLMSNAAFLATANTFTLGYPANVPIPMDRVTVATNTSRKLLTINTGAISPSVSAAVTYNVNQANITPVAKTVNRHRMVRLRLSNNADTTIGPWALGVSDVFRLNAVYLGTNGTFGPSTGQDVTQNFYIDHNQTEDYYGMSYLYLKPKANITLQSTDFLLVDFDYFTHNATGGLKAPGGSGTYPLNDGISLASSTGTINTLEIPEVYGNRGNYYDLRDQFDIRPNSVATATPVTAANFATAPINPAELSYSSAFSGDDKKFPVPDSELSATITNYVGRTDRVIIDTSNQFRVIKGTPGSKEAPPSPENALTINVLNIPAYPSHPFVLSANTTAFADTKIANEKYTTHRLNNYRVATPLGVTDRNALQPRNYTMQDIGKLERRIDDLEYYTSLSLTETIAQKRSIPGYDGADRFKFGFFVDGFEDYTYADISNPHYSATIVDGYLSPLVNEINIGLSNSGTDAHSLPYVEKTLVSQTRATDGAVEVAPVEPTVVQIITNIVQEQRSNSRDDNGNVFEEFFYTFSSLSGPVEFYISSKNNRIGAEIFQSRNTDGPWTQTISSASASPITSNDVSTKQLYLNGGREIEHLGSIQRLSDPYSTSWGTWLEDQFKLLWTHNPDQGMYYKVRIYKGGRHGGFLGLNRGAAGTFGYKLYYPTDTTVNQLAAIDTTNYRLTYGGLGVSLREDYGYLSDPLWNHK
jgi:hypothetical protein